MYSNFARHNRTWKEKEPWTDFPQIFQVPDFSKLQFAQKVVSPASKIKLYRLITNLFTIFSRIGKIFYVYFLLFSVGMSKDYYTTQLFVFPNSYRYGFVTKIWKFYFYLFFIFKLGWRPYFKHYMELVAFCHFPQQKKEKKKTIRYSNMNVHNMTYRNSFLCLRFYILEMLLIQRQIIIKGIIVETLEWTQHTNK